MREAGISEAIEAKIVFGKASRLTAANQEFLAIHTEAETDALRGGVILLHDINSNADGLDVINPLRTELPKHRWETLSIQLPVAMPGASKEEWATLIEEAFPRIDAAIEFFKTRTIEHLIVVGHGMGARIGLQYLNGKDPKPKQIKALVAIGLGVEKDDAKSIEALKGLTLPVFDLFGSRDYDTVINSRRLKRISSQYAKEAKYFQAEVLGADHYFRGSRRMLIVRIRDWIAKHAPSTKPISYEAIGKATKTP